MSSRSSQLAAIIALTFLGCAPLGGCGGMAPLAGVSDSNAENGAANPNELDPSDAGGEASDAPESVGDVSNGLGDAVFDDSGYVGEGVVRVLIRNASDVVVDVTTLFIRDDATVHLTFVQVLPETVSVVVSPVAADLIRLVSVTADDVALATVTFRYGVDFDELSAAVFEISPDITDPSGGDPSQDPNDPSQQPPKNLPGPFAPPSIDLLEPATDRSVALGSTFQVRWTDESELDGAIVTIWMEPVNGGKDAERVQVAAAVAERRDGINDEIQVLVQGLEPGSYLVIGEILVADAVTTSIAGGRINVFVAPHNEAPTIKLTSPTSPVRINDGDAIDISWEDFDGDFDDNALISFSLAASQPSPVRLSYRIGHLIAEDPDGPVYDSARLPVTGVLPGWYDLVATIDDGELRGAARIPAIVEVMPQRDNDPPTIVLQRPAKTINVGEGGTVWVRWSDADANDNAIISLMLDSDLGGGELNGDEILLVSSLSEDPDGAGNDEASFILPSQTPLGTYAMVAAITDGMVETVSFAPGLISVVETPGAPPPEPSIKIVGPQSALFLRYGSHIRFGAVVREARNYEIRLALVNELLRVEATHATEQTLVNGQNTTLDIDTALLGIPNEVNLRWFDIEVSLHVDGRLVDADVAWASVWIRQEVEIRSAELVEISCQGGGGILDPSTDPGLAFAWYGGGFLAGGEVPSPVEFWLAKNGAWPPSIPHGKSRRHRRVLSTVESPAVLRDEFVPWEEFADLEPGHYVLLALVRHPVFGEILHIPRLDPIEVCAVSDPGHFPQRP